MLKTTRGFKITYPCRETIQLFEKKKTQKKPAISKNNGQVNHFRFLSGMIYQFSKLSSD